MRIERDSCEPENRMWLVWDSRISHVQRILSRESHMSHVLSPWVTLTWVIFCTHRHESNDWCDSRVWAWLVSERDSLWMCDHIFIHEHIYIDRYMYIHICQRASNLLFPGSGLLLWVCLLSLIFLESIRVHSGTLACKCRAVLSSMCQKSKFRTYVSKTRAWMVSVRIFFFLYGLWFFLESEKLCTYKFIYIYMCKYIWTYIYMYT